MSLSSGTLKISMLFVLFLVVNRDVKGGVAANVESLILSRQDFNLCRGKHFNVLHLTEIDGTVLTVSIAF